MPSWSEVVDEISQIKNPFDTVRERYLKKLCQHTGRNVICYYSGWMQHPEYNCDINVEDKNAFMSVIHRLDRSKGLDLILHTPGGSIVAAESLMDYILVMFNNNVRAIVPQLSMSAGTMLACACSKIIMGKQSSLGPIDPQFNGIPAQGIIEEFKTIQQDCLENPNKIVAWQYILNKYQPTFIGECQNAIALSQDICKKWLVENMLKNRDNKEDKAREIVNSLSDHSISKTHARHLNIDYCKSIGLEIDDLEADNKLQDIVLTLHHAYMHTLANTQTAKIVENQKGTRMVMGIRN